MNEDRIVSRSGLPTPQVDRSKFLKLVEEREREGAGSRRDEIAVYSINNERHSNPCRITLTVTSQDKYRKPGINEPSLGISNDKILTIL